MNTVVYLLQDNHTDKVQPIDAGFGKAMKQKIGEAMQKKGSRRKQISKSGMEKFLLKKEESL